MEEKNSELILPDVNNETIKSILEILINALKYTQGVEYKLDLNTGLSEIQSVNLDKFKYGLIENLKIELNKIS